jgi:FAD binding domain/Berberine and berberine like
VTSVLEALQTRLDGRLIGPDDSNWDEARAAWNLSVDQHPAAVALPESAEDVAAVVAGAREQGLRVAPQGTGHGAQARGSLEDSVLLKTERMRGAEVDVDARRARVQAGAQWGDLTPLAAQDGLASLSGSAGDVGIVGYSVGGGVGWMVRKHGLAANSIASAQVVTADGDLVTADRDSEPDLFWALRGGGGSFGAVTALEIELLPITELYAGVLFWPQERAGEVLSAWRDWTDGVPEEMTSLGRLLNVPPFPEVPEPIRGRSFVVVEAAFLGDEAAGAELLAPLRELGAEMDTFTTMPPPQLATVHNDPPEPVPGAGDGVLLDRLDDGAIEGLVQRAGPESGAPLVSLEIRHLGGAAGRPDPEGGALDHIPAAFATYAVGIAPTPEMKAAVQESAGQVREAFAQCLSASTFLNFTEQPRTDTATMFTAEAHKRLGAVKHAYDPDDVFQSNHPIAPAAG